MKILDGLIIANKIAQEWGGKCLSNEYVNNKTVMLWQCKNKHDWYANLDNIKNKNKWCAECNGVKKLSINIAKQVAVSNNGLCLSNVYNRNSDKLMWQCNNKHIWMATLADVKNGDKWCASCANVKKLDGIKIAQEIARRHDGRCLSSKYINNKINLLWSCKFGHKWHSSLNNVKNKNHWCHECAEIKRSISQNNSFILYHWKTNRQLVCVAGYEKAVVEYFNKNKINFRWQPKTFIMPNKRTYRPDLYLFSTKKWIEIKGYFRDDAEEKWKWFHKEHPNSELWNKEKLKEMRIL